MDIEQRAVLAHIVIDPDSWYSHAITTFGQLKANEFLAAKIARWKPDYDAAVAAGNYQTRAQREQA